MTLYEVDSRKGDLKKYEIRKFKDFYDEKDIQDWIEENPNVVYEEEPLLIIGRELVSDTGHPLDLLGLDKNGYPVVIELKATRTPREVTSQVLDYASWIGRLSRDEFIETVEREYIKRKTKYESLAEAFNEKFGADGDDRFNKLCDGGHLNSKRRLVVIAERVDLRTRRIAKELDSNGALVDILSYTYYIHDGKEYLDFNTVFRSIPPEVEVGHTLQELRQKVLDEGRTIEIFDYMHELLADRGDLTVKVGTEGAIYQISKENKLRSLLNLYPRSKDMILRVYLYHQTLPDSIDTDELIEDICEITSSSKGEITREEGKTSSFEIKNQKEADGFLDLLDGVLTRQK